MKLLKKLLLLLMLAMPLAAAGVYLFKTLDVRQGLTSSQINCILKDSRGYVWMGTPAGLYRYDGYTFKNYQCNSQDGSSLPDGYIISLQEALDGNIWVQTSAGYCVYHPQTETFERDMKAVYNRLGIVGMPNVVYFDTHKNLWASIPNKGVVAYNMQQQLLYEFTYTNDSQGIPQGTIVSIGECKDGAIIVYEDGRLVCCDVMHGQHTVWQTSFIADNKIRKSTSLKVFTDNSGTIWLYGQGTLMRYNENTNEWDTTVGDKLGLTSISVDHSINGMACDKTGNVWIGSDRMGLIRTNSNGDEMENVQPKNAIENNPLANDIVGIRSLYVDDTNLLWVGTEKSGVAFYGEDIYKFQATLNGDITAIAQDQDGHIWFGTSDHGVIGYEGSLASQKVSCMATTADGSLWVGSRQNGLTRIHKGQTSIFSASRDSARTIIDDHINALTSDKFNNLWIATNGGLQVYNPKMNTFSSYTKENDMLNTNNITSLFYGKNNKMMVGTAEGLVIINLSTRDKIVLTGNESNLSTFTNNYITQVYEDSRGLLWIGTREGLNILNRENDNLDYLTEKNGLCNNSICGITEDLNHNIWVTTSNGVCRIVIQRNHENGTFNYGLYNYSTSDGLQSNEFNMGAILTKADGNVLFGGLYGVNWVRKNAQKGKESLPRVMLTQLFIGEEEVQIGHEYDGNTILAQALNESNHIELNNNQNNFTIKFAAGNYNQGERLQFMYMLEGRDNFWSNGDALLHGVKFKDLASGTYVLHVKAVSADGAVSNQERTLEIVIGRPWWLSWWMLTVYVIIAIVVLVMWRWGFKKFKTLLRHKRAVIAELKNQREQIKLASDDLRQPMARMTTIISNLADKEQTVDGKEQLNSLHFQMLQIITRISEMQMGLENPEVKAESKSKDRLEIGNKSQADLTATQLPKAIENIKPIKLDAPTQNFQVMIVDDNKEFLLFMKAHLCELYTLHLYDDIRKAAHDVEAVKADLVVCKQELHYMSGSALCDRIKSNPRTEKTKVVITTERMLSAEEMRDENISLAADDYLAKPFNIQEAVARFNILLGLGETGFTQDAIEGYETRKLESQNASMTTATLVYSDNSDSQTTVTPKTPTEKPTVATEKKPDDSLQQTGLEIARHYYGDGTIGDYTMSSLMDQQLMKNVEQYVLQNMSRGQINLEEMAATMGMGRVPFFHKIRSITTKTPAELIREIRLKHACTLLVRTNLNLSELAINVGFMTAENFINIFQSKYGMSPLEYRLKYAKS